MARKSGEHRRHHRGSSERRSSSRHGSSSRDIASPSRSSIEHRFSVEREGSVRTKDHSTPSSSRSTSVPKNDDSIFSYGPSGHIQKRLVVVDSTDSDSDENGSNELSSSNTSQGSWMEFSSLFGIGAFIMGVIIAVVTTYMLMKGDNSSKNISSNTVAESPGPVQAVPTMSPTDSRTGMPTVEYPPPELAVCEALSDGQDFRTFTSDDTLITRNMDITFDVTVRPGGNFRTEEELFEFFPKKVESALVLSLAGCYDVEGFQRKLNPIEQNSFHHRALDELEQIRYVIAGGALTGKKVNKAECSASTSGQLLSCFEVVVYFEFFLKGDERVFQVLSLITSILNQMSSPQAPVASIDSLTPQLVTRLGLPNPPFQNVVVRGIQNNDPTVSPSASPSQFPTGRPSASPSSEPTKIPSVAPSAAPSESPSSIPSSEPSMSPTHGPTKAPTARPTQAPTAKPSAFPTRMPSVSPSASPSTEPSIAPSSVPSLSNAPSFSSAPSLAPSISNAPTSRMSFIIEMLPPTYNNMTAIDWLSYNDTWLPDHDDSGLWADRYAIFLSFQEMAGFVKDGESVCVWTGINCDANGRIIEVSLPSNGLTSGIPSEVSMLSELRTLNLTENAYTGTFIPTEIFGLPKLELLDISNSGINGTIPTQIANLASLRELHLNSNNLVGTIPKMPELVTRSPDDVITLGNGIEVACVCEMYGNQLEVNTISTANAGGCDLVRTASDSSSSSSSTSDDTPSGSTTSAPATRIRYRSLFERGFRALEDESSSDDEDQHNFRLPVDAIVRAPRAAKKISHLLMKKKRRTKKGKKQSMVFTNVDLREAGLVKFEISDDEE